jgi:Mrp family chromosome partitioning ATPase
MMATRWQMIGIVGALLVVGCKKPAPPSAQAPGAAPPAAEVTPTAKAVPSSVNDAEGTAEDVQDDIMKNDWSKASDKTRHLQELSAKMRQDSVPAADLATYDSAVATLASNVAKKAQLPAAMAANNAYRATLAMMSRYSTKQPPQVGLMDADARDAGYHAAAGDWSGAEKAATSFTSSYREIEPTVKSKNAQLDAQVGGHLNELDRAIKAKNAAAVTTAAKALEEDVDKIEKLY